MSYFATLDPQLQFLIAFGSTWLVIGIVVTVVLAPKERRERLGR